MSFTQDEIAMLRSSFFDLIPQTEDLSAQFYERMFQDHPEVRPLFKQDIRSQQDKLVDTLAALLDFIEDSDKVALTLSQLGKKHTSYGASKEMYLWIERVLPELIALRISHDKDQMLSLWGRLIRVVSEAMMEASN